MASQREYEERKLALYGELLASIAFRRDISRAHANYMIREVERLSYRQLCFLAAACRRAVGAPSLTQIAHEDARTAEIDDLFSRKLLRLERPDQTASERRLIASANGRLFCETMALDRLTDSQISEVVSISMSRTASDNLGGRESV